MSFLLPLRDPTRHEWEADLIYFWASGSPESSRGYMVDACTINVWWDARVQLPGLEGWPGCYTKPGQESHACEIGKGCVVGKRLC